MIKEIYFAGGCFWGTEHFFKQIEGVTDTETGFANGHTESPTYKEVYTDTTGFAETVRVRYDSSRVSLPFLLRMFFKAIDPTSLNATLTLRICPPGKGYAHHCIASPDIPRGKCLITTTM